MLFAWSKKATRRWLVYALAHARAHENLSAQVQSRALKAANSQETDENKLISWFHSLPDADRFIDQGLAARRRFVWMMLAAFTLAFLAGGATALSALSGAQDGIVNILWVLGSLLGLHIVMLLVWLVALNFFPSNTLMHGLGALMMRIWQRLQWKRKAPKTSATQKAFVDILMAGSAGRWMASAVSHGLWAGYIFGAFMMLVVAFSARHYVFIWETTILSAADYARIFAYLFRPLAFLGFSVPGVEDIAAAQGPGDSPGQSALWASFILAAVLIYGLLPRMALFILCLYRARRALDRTGIELDRPFFQTLIPQLAPVVQQTRILDDAPINRMPDPGRSGWSDQYILPMPDGPVAIMGLECAIPDMGWPPGPATGIVDFGIHDGRESEKAIAGKQHLFARLIVVVDLVATPDRGMEAALSRIYAHAGDTLVVLLSRHAACLERLGRKDTEIRLSDWVMAAHRVGCALHSIVALDLDRDDEDARAALVTLYGIRGQDR